MLLYSIYLFNTIKVSEEGENKWNKKFIWLFYLRFTQYFFIYGNIQTTKMNQSGTPCTWLPLVNRLSSNHTNWNTIGPISNPIRRRVCPSLVCIIPSLKDKSSGCAGTLFACKMRGTKPTERAGNSCNYTGSAFRGD